MPNPPCHPPFTFDTGTVVLNIEDPETDRLVRELAAATGESLTVAARVAVAERLHRVRARETSDADRARVREIIERARGRGIVDERTDDEILGYDEAGLPQ